MRRSIALSLLWSLLVPCAPGQEQPGGLRIVVLQGEGAFNDVRRRIGRDTVVEVRNEDNRAVSGAQVVFTLPDAGPSGVFEGGVRSMTVTTDANGIAATRGFKPNDIEGRFTIRVTATLGGKVGTAAVSQSNTLAGGVVQPERGGGSKKALILLGIAGGAAAGIIAGTRGGGSSGPVGPPPTTLSAGTVSVGGPR